MTTCLSTPTEPKALASPVSLAGSLASWLSSWVAAASAERGWRRTGRSLSSLDDRALRDIGLDRLSLLRPSHRRFHGCPEAETSFLPSPRDVRAARIALPLAGALLALGIGLSSAAAPASAAASRGMDRKAQPAPAVRIGRRPEPRIQCIRAPCGTPRPHARRTHAWPGLHLLRGDVLDQCPLWSVRKFPWGCEPPLF